MVRTKFGDQDVLLVSVVDLESGEPANPGATPGEAIKSGTLANTTPLVIDLQGIEKPIVITISGAAGGVRRIELSTDGGTENGWFMPVYDASTNSMINVQVAANATHARLTGAVGDAWSVR